MQVSQYFVSVKKKVRVKNRKQKPKNQLGFQTVNTVGDGQVIIKGSNLLKKQ